jgi:exodeoxyribonuclease V alpha subunit
VLQAITEASEPLGMQVYMMALSGRAARRMSKVTGREAMTIASFLTAVDAERIDLSGEPTIAIDESSMLDLPIMYRLLRRLEPGCKLLLLGDPGQLPPIGFGIIFHELVKNKGIPQVELTEIHRQAAHTGIPQMSQAVRIGEVPVLMPYHGKDVGVSFIECPWQEIPDVVLDTVHELGGVRLSQVIGPLKSGNVGTHSINTLFQNLLKQGCERYYGFSVGEPVIWLVNDYDLGLMNGSLGIVKAIEEDGLRVLWDEGEMVIKEEDVAAKMGLAYAITVHKAQGSQWKRVVVPIFESRILDRALLYTAITRAELQVVLVGDWNAFEKAIMEPPSASRRETAIQKHLDA